MSMSFDDLLPELAAKFEALQTLFEAIGTPEEVRQQDCQTLFDRCISVVDTQVAELTQSKQQLAQACDRLLEGIRTMTSLLGQGDEGIQRLLETLQGMKLWDRHRLLHDEHRYILEHYKQKLGEIQALHQRLSSFVSILGPSCVQPGPNPEEGAIVTFDVVQQYEDNIATCEKEQKRRKESVELAIAGIKTLWTQLGMVAQDSFDKEVIDVEQDDRSVTDDTLRRLEMKGSMLESERQRRKILLKEHLTEISSLWDKLRIEEKDQEEFLTTHDGLTLEDIRAHKEELDRLEDLKSEKLEEFIMTERETIYGLWDRLYYSWEQRETFSPVFNNTFTDENLAAHEAEVKRLKEELTEHEHVLTAVEKYQVLLDDIRDFEQTSMDKERLFHRDPGRLLREEKFRKRIAREFPKAETELLEVLTAWQEEKGRPFLVYGEEYIAMMKLHEQEAREGKENEKRRREQQKQEALQQELRYGSQNPKKAPPQSPHPRRISPSNVPPVGTSGRKSPPPPSSSSAEPRTPTSKRTTNMLLSRPGTPTTQHTRPIPSFMPTTPTRARSQTLQTTPGHSRPNQNSFLQSPRGAHFQRQQQHQGAETPGGGHSNRVYSRSESPASSAFVITRLPTTPTSSRMRASATPALDGGRYSPSSSKRTNSIISISSATTESMEEGGALLSSPSNRRSKSVGRVVSYDLTGVHEADETTPLVSSGKSNRTASNSTVTATITTPRGIKRPAADLFSPSGSPRVPQQQRRRSRSGSPARRITTIDLDTSPFMADDTLNGATSGREDFSQSSMSKRPNNNKFMKQLLQAQQEESVIDLDAESKRDDRDDSRRSLIELDRSEAEKFFSSAPTGLSSGRVKMVKELKVQEAVEGEDIAMAKNEEGDDRNVEEDEGWETDNGDSPRSRRQSKNGTQPVSS
ncbi:hypothetical protein BGZ83_003582 [Gryganskiella cystojenkinii]|nr:hypothetical protein BGZ83_003582 [Gryganskiella cystojenkinii]